MIGGTSAGGLMAVMLGRLCDEHTNRSGRPAAPPPLQPRSTILSLSAPSTSNFDGALGKNNPVFALWNQALDVWGDRLRGSLWCLPGVDRTGVPVRRWKKLGTEIEKTEEQFRRDKVDLDNDDRYFRFNESKKKAEIAAATRDYVQSQEVLKHMTALANGLSASSIAGWDTLCVRLIDLETDQDGLFIAFEAGESLIDRISLSGVLQPGDDPVTVRLSSVSKVPPRFKHV
ncbi:hypothetical protein SODALDRAFT_350465 [Sodiomyces alkalinus F11]|uniref:PNPLA domain-containing protein n=1 Tax=Sodiomyces alkalinus (strain CBS 110278 / VKM F-3762 / F11) TaxID=1314773 RepID=A0A3N2PXV1_SODAK|nr:hypothetical protein SODALDRAFT_350465 [Sodiomyces alkalinus F11]ROT39294.1 hypothetical protein SODALDRAFT_350465 [Sodiomyces alkalinus F11]